MPMIVDAHAHIFPKLTGACGYPTVEEHRRFLQLYIATHGEPVYRLRDNAIVPEAASILFSGELDSFDCLHDDADFRVGRFGRFEWEYEGDTYYRSFLPPSLQEMVAPVDFLRQSMARAGVDRAVLQNAGLYGRLNSEFADAMRAHPDTFIGLADVRPAECDRPEEGERLRSAVQELGLRGIYYANRGLIANRYQYGFDDPAFDGYWETVRSLDIPIFWEILGTPLPTMENYLRELDRLDRWLQRWPDIPCVLTHGFSPDLLEGTIPDPVRRLLGRENLMIELLYPIHWGRLHDYPWRELRPAIERQLNLAGAARLVWGSDMPNVERNCTYRQSLEYLPRVLQGVAPAAALDSMVGGNLARLFSLARIAHALLRNSLSHAFSLQELTRKEFRNEVEDSGPSHHSSRRLGTHRRSRGYPQSTRNQSWHVGRAAASTQQRLRNSFGASSQGAYERMPRDMENGSHRAPKSSIPIALLDDGDVAADVAERGVAHHAPELRIERAGRCWPARRSPP